MKSKAEREFAYQRAAERNKSNFEHWFMPALRRDVSMAERTWLRIGAFASWIVSRNVLTYHDVRHDWPARIAPGPNKQHRLDVPKMRQPSAEDTIASAQAYLNLADADSPERLEITAGLNVAGWGGFSMLYDTHSSASAVWQRMEDGLCANPQLLENLGPIALDDKRAFAAAIARLGESDSPFTQR
jgi:hypothetical protein